MPSIELLLIFSVCVVTGIFTGLLGIGGGLIVVPAFLTVFPLFGMGEFSIHQIIGISATCVFFNSSSSLFFRRKDDFMPFFSMLKMSVAIICGTLLGVHFSSLSPAKPLLLVYCGVSLISLYLLKREISCSLEKKRFKAVFYLSLMLVGAISASIGIGGAVLFAAVLKCFTEKNTKEILPTITFLVAINALFTFGGKFLINEITPAIIPVAALASLIGAKIGVVISRKLKSETITNLMAATLLIALVRVVIELAHQKC